MNDEPMGAFLLAWVLAYVLEIRSENERCRGWWKL